MFGIYRYLLANLVVLAHLWWQLTHWTGWYAVFGFYVLSGYLMALVLDRVYPLSVGGTTRFLANRALRIFPPYLVILGLASLLVFWIPHAARTLNASMAFPSAAWGWVSNLVIFGLNSEPQRLVPPAWSLDVELCFYVGMGLLLARWRSIVVVWFIASLAFTVYTNLVDAPFLYRYRATPSASLPFSLGALLYHFRCRLALESGWHVPAAATLFFGHAALAGSIWEGGDGLEYAGFYYSMFAAGYLTLALSVLDRRQVPGWLVRLDRRLGDLSYPIFLGHWSAATLVNWALFSGERTQGLAFFLPSLLVVHGLAWAVHGLVETPVEATRAAIRKRAAPGV